MGIHASWRGCVSWHESGDVQNLVQLHRTEEPVEVCVQSGDRGRSTSKFHQVVQLQAKAEAAASSLLDLMQIDREMVAFHPGFDPLLDLSHEMQSHGIIDVLSADMGDEGGTDSPKCAMECVRGCVCRCIQHRGSSLFRVACTSYPSPPSMRLGFARVQRVKRI